MLACLSPLIRPLLQFQSPILYPFLPLPLIILIVLLFDVLPHAQDSSGVAVTDGGGIAVGGGGAGSAGCGPKLIGASVQTSNLSVA